VPVVQSAFAAGATADPATVRKVDVLPQCRLQKGLAGVDGDFPLVDDRFYGF
jgi:hypothetical protein